MYTLKASNPENEEVFGGYVEYNAEHGIVKCFLCHTSDQW